MPTSPLLSQKPPAVRTRGVRKTFGHVVANDGIDLEVPAGSIHALLGENGAGKTTLMNILYGLIHPDDGEIEIHGKPVRLASSADAISHGIAMVHQHFMLVGRFTVVENVVLGLGTPGGQLQNLAEPARRIQEISTTYGIRVDPWGEVDRLSVGEQQRVEIIKALYRNADILILDEPTSVLTPQEVDQLFEVLRTFTAQGHTVIFISHKLNEVLAISSQITVLRDGKCVGTIPTREANRERLARMMVGREVSLDMSGEARKESGEVVLTLEGICAANDRGLPGLVDVSLEVHSGEILGIAGVDGNGQHELAEIILGARRVTRGSIHLAGTNITRQTPHEAIQRGIALIPVDRRESGLLPGLPLWWSLLLGVHDQAPYVRGGFYNKRAIRSMAARLLHQFEVRPEDMEWPAGSLSGGNQQKLVLAREIDKHPRLLIASQPTLGLDIKTTEYVRRLLLSARQNGVSILLISTDLQEVLSLSDRVAVLYEGRIMGMMDAAEATTERIGLLMAGVAQNEPGEALHA